MIRQDCVSGTSSPDMSVVALVPHHFAARVGDFVAISASVISIHEASTRMRPDTKRLYIRGLAVNRAAAG
jgi:hypothetical protein